MSSSRPIDNPKDPRTDEKPVFSKELVQEESTEASEMDAEQEEPKWKDHGSSNKLRSSLCIL